MQPPTNNVNVYIYEWYYQPRSITIPPKTWVTWVNKDEVEHFVVGDWGGYYPVSPGHWASLPGSEFHAGKTYRYEDENNSSMRGEIIYTEG
jgi:plastocyanin